MLASVPNFRDIGGYATHGQRRVRRGRIFRSSQLSHLSTADQEAVRAIGLRATIDLRSDRERAAQPTPTALQMPGDYLSPKPDTDFIFNRIFAQTERTAQAWAQAFGAFYSFMLDAYAVELVAMFRAIADDSLPLLIHCSAGKDRTGAASALLLDLLGVARADIIDDYVRSSALLDGDTHFRNMLSDAKLDLYAALPGECRQVMLGTDPAYLDSLFATLDDQFGSVADYLAHHGFGAAGIDHIVATLTEPMAQSGGPDRPAAPDCIGVKRM